MENKPIVMVVDDDKNIGELIRLYLEKEGFEVRAFQRGDEAVAAFRTNPPSLVLLDIMLPGMDGWHVLEAMARDERLKSIPVYLVSAQDPSERPLISELCLATVKGGVPLNRLLRWSQEASTLLLAPESTSDPEPE